MGLWKSLSEIGVQNISEINSLPRNKDIRHNQEDTEVKVFLIGDAASCAKKAQKVPQGYYNVEIMLKGVTRRDGEIGVCGTCMDARGITENELTDGARRSTLDELTEWTLWADKVLVF